MKGIYESIEEMHMRTRKILAFSQTTEYDVSAFPLRLFKIPN